MEGFVYILKSEKTGSFYVGSTENVENRFKMHCNGLVKSTKGIIPLKLVFFKKYSTIKEARQVEYRLKKFKSRKILERIIQDNDIMTAI